MGLVKHLCQNLEAMGVRVEGSAREHVTGGIVHGRPRLASAALGIL